VKLRKFLSDNTIAVTATARVPIVGGGHSEALNVEFTKDFDVNEVRSILQETDGIIVQDNLKNLNIQCLYAEVKRSICR
jgi:aspartate-semialdehyde dehydrogenase